MSREQIIQSLWGENRGKVILLGLLILIVVGVQLWQVYWIDQKLESSRGELQRTQSELRSLQTRVAEGGGAELSGRADDLEHFYKMVPSRTGLGSFIGRVYSYASSAGIDIAKISYSAENVEGTRLLGYGLSFTVNGSYAQVKRFIHELENSPSLLILERIALAEHRQVAEEIVNLQIQIKTFFREGLE